MNSFWLIEDYIFANDFLRFLTGHLKNVKSHVFFWNLKKNVKYEFANTGPLFCRSMKNKLWYSQLLTSLFFCVPAVAYHIT